ncbi:MAG: PhoX family phosphatase [Cyclobacteriaceae bacterium]
MTYLIFVSCSPERKKDSFFITSLSPFPTEEELSLHTGLNYTILFKEGDTVYNSEGLVGKAKGNHDCITLQSSAKNKATLFIGHETRRQNDLLGDGGGATLFDIEKQSGKWAVSSKKYNVDFREVGATLNNCGGTLTPKGTILSAEEIAPPSNEMIKPLISDLSDFGGKPKYLNFGWMVEIDPKLQVATQKLFSMGRYKHEDAQCMPDGKTVYLTNDNSPALFFKFVADKIHDYSKGQLYAYQQNTDDRSGHWLLIPRDRNSLERAREIGIRLGATLFNRHEWISLVGDKLYITETGKDEANWDKFIKMGGKPAHYFKRNEKGLFDDPYGRVLVFDLATQKIDVLIEGGISEKDPQTVFSNPDGMEAVQWKGRNYLMLNEDIIGTNRQRSIYSTAVFNEIYLLDLSIPNPKVADLERVLVAPKGAETTGSTFSPDKETFFVNIQHPNPNNKVINRSATIAITGWKTFLK